MPKVTPGAVNRLWRRAESGFTVTIQAVFYIFLLFIFLAFIFDFGLVGYLYSIGSASMKTAAQDAAKNVDTTDFATTQEIRLSENALAVAQQEVRDMSGGKVQVLSLRISRLDTRDVIVITGHVDCPLPLLGSLFGLQMVIVPVQAYAEPAYGINQEGQ
jgi:hypothetical protein